ncbi:protein WVD2-like 2 isoform X1 [Miscanthus floridulus]|uniref:protein WVD2-like 2 n=1 Tax=Miscanthus floridulus TaxID=154761 RepID=UPI00345AB04A
MGKEVVDMSTDEESDCVVICPPNGNADHEEVVSGSHDEDSSGRQENTHAMNSHMDSNSQDDVSVNPDLLKPIHQQESSLSNSPAKPTVARQQGSRHTVPEPCTVAPERRSSGAGNCAPIPHPISNGEKLSDKSSSSPRSMAKKSPSVTPRMPLQSDNSSHSPEEDSYSVTSSTVTSARAGKTKKTTVAVAPTFVCANRAEKRGEFYTKLEEKRKALEEEKLQAEARKREEEEEALRQLRKNLVVRAKPMPSFYQEGPPPKVELKKVPPTRAKSPKLTRRKSCSDTPHTPEGGNGSAVCCRLHRHSIGNSKDVSSKAQCSAKSASKTGSATKSRVTKSREDLKASMKKVGQPSAANFAVQT